MSIATQQEDTRDQWNIDDFVKLFLEYVGNRLRFSQIETLYGDEPKVKNLKKLFQYRNLSTNDRHPEYLTMNFLNQFINDPSEQDQRTSDFYPGRPMRIWMGEHYLGPNSRSYADNFPNPGDGGIREFPYWNTEREAKNPKHFFKCWLQAIDNMYQNPLPNDNVRPDDIRNIRPYYENQCQLYQHREAARAFLQLRRRSRIPDLPINMISDHYLTSP